MRFEVPQFIEIEDKIFGPFTWRQFVYIAGGGGFGVMLYLLNLPFIILVLLGAPVIGLAAALAFYPVNNRPFSIFLESVVSYVTAKKLYLWKKRSVYTYTENQGLDVSTIPTPAAAGGPAKHGIASLSRKLELNALQGDAAADALAKKAAEKRLQK